MPAAFPIDVRLASAEDLAFVSVDARIPPPRLANLIASGCVYLATRDGAPLGHARVEHLWAKIPYIALICVLEQHRRRGVGRALVAAIARDARGAGHDFLYSSSQTDASAAQLWHRRVGFEECGLIAGINPGGVGEVFFRKLLSG